MAFDGFTVAALKDELERALTGGTVSRVTQPEKDELLLSVRVVRRTFRKRCCDFGTVSGSGTLPVYTPEEHAASSAQSSAQNSETVLLKRFMPGLQICGRFIRA